MLEVKNIIKRYGTQVVLNDVSLQLNRGEVLGFLGPNGAGKSTLMKSILGLVEPDSGSIYIDSKELIYGDVRQNALIGYLPELNPLYEYMYVAEYLEFVAECYGVKAQLKREAVERVIEQTGLTLERGKTISQLSKGYKQRVGLAAAIIHNPQLLILDEPMTGLDPNQQVEIRTLIKELSADRAIMISTHIMQEVEAVCDKIVIIDRGNIKYAATQQEVIAEHGSAENAFIAYTKDN